MEMDSQANHRERLLCMNKEQEKVEREISKVLDESEKMQNFSLFRGFPQACLKKNPPTLVVWNAKLTVLLSPPRLV